MTKKKEIVEIAL